MISCDAYEDNLKMINVFVIFSDTLDQSNMCNLNLVPSSI